MRKEVDPPAIRRYERAVVCLILLAMGSIATSAVFHIARNLGKEDAAAEARVRMWRLQRDIGIDPDSPRPVLPQECVCNQNGLTDHDIERWLSRAINGSH